MIYIKKQKIFCFIFCIDFFVENYFMFKICPLSLKFLKPFVLFVPTLLLHIFYFPYYFFIIPYFCYTCHLCFKYEKKRKNNRKYEIVLIFGENNAFH